MFVFNFQSISTSCTLLDLPEPSNPCNPTVRAADREKGLMPSQNKNIQNYNSENENKIQTPQISPQTKM